MPPALSAIAARLPGALYVSVCLPLPAETAPLSARQLLKQATLGGAVKLGAPRTDGEPLELRFGERVLGLSRAELGADVESLLRRALAALLEPALLVAVLAAFAEDAARQLFLTDLTRHMLSARDLDHALYIMLSGITSGQGASFNRAALFLPAEEGGYRGSKGIGPHDGAEAHRIWEAIEYEGKKLDHLVQDYSSQNFDTRFQQRVQALPLCAGEGEQDEIRLAEASPSALRFEGIPENASLRELSVSGQFVLARIRPRGHTLGLLFVDDAYTRAPLTDARLSALDFVVSQTALVWENRSLLERLDGLVRVDALTGVATRRELEARFAEVQSRARRGGGPCGFLMLDLDNFKSINDSQGHAAGDAVLRRMGTLLRECLRAHDIAGRFGGDEFAIVLPDASHADVRAVADRVARLAAAADIGLSIGGACFPADATDPAELFRLADERLYGVKRGGRGAISLGELPASGLCHRYGAFRCTSTNVVPVRPYVSGVYISSA